MISEASITLKGDLRIITGKKVNMQVRSLEKTQTGTQVIKDLVGFKSPKAVLCFEVPASHLFPVRGILIPPQTHVVADSAFPR